MPRVSSMNRQGDFASPGKLVSEHSEPQLDDAQQWRATHDDSFTKEQIAEIEQLLNRIGADDSDDELLGVSDAGQMVKEYQMSRTEQQPRRMISPPKKRQESERELKERVWQAHLSDVRNYLAEKNRTVNQAILEERKFKKETHQKQPWQHSRRSTTGHSKVVQMPNECTEYYVESREMRDFVQYRSS